MSKLGRPRKPIELHVLNGTYRKDRHGPLPPRARAIGGAGMTAGLLVEADALTGDTLAAALLTGWHVDDVLGQLEVQTARTALNRALAVDALLDGPTGAIARAATGEVGSKVLDALLRARTTASQELRGALDRLDLQPVSVRHREVS